MLRPDPFNSALTHTTVRDAQWTPSREVFAYADELIGRVLDEAERLGLKRKPVA
jgi:hypothetical protein